MVVERLTDRQLRQLDFTLLANGETPTLTTADSEQQPSPHVFSLLARQGLAKFEEDSGRTTGRHHPHAAGLSLFAFFPSTTINAR